MKRVSQLPQLRVGSLCCRSGQHPVLSPAEHGAFRQTLGDPAPEPAWGHFHLGGAYTGVKLVFEHIPVTAWGDGEEAGAL